jgi:RNase P subunit RPR2
MKANIKATNDLSFQVEAETEDELFKQVARIQEVFQHESCGQCNSKKVSFVCRHDSSENDWLEVVCKECRAKVIFGRTKKGGQIYPKIKWDQLSEKQKQQRANEKGYAESHRGYLPYRGWFIYKPPVAPQ